MSITRIISSLMILCFLARASASTAEYHLEGTYFYKAYGATTNNVVISDRGFFSADVRGCQWYLKLSSSPTNNQDILEIGCDEPSQVCALFRPRIGAEARKLNPEVNGEIGTMEPFIHPLGQGSPPVVAIWWAYASGCYLQTNGTQRVKPLLLVESEQQALYYTDYAVEAAIKQSRSNPFLPLKSVLFGDGNIRYWDDPLIAEVGDPFEVRKRPSPFGQKFTNIVYEATEIALVNQTEYARKFTFAEFKPVATSLFPSNYRLLLTKMITGTVTNASPHSRLESFLPEIRDRIAFADHRFATETPPLAMVDFGPRDRSGGWITKDDSRKSREFTAAIQERKAIVRVVRDDIGKRAVRKTYKYIFFILFGIPAFLFFLKKVSPFEHREETVS